MTTIEKVILGIVVVLIIFIGVVGYNTFVWLMALEVNQ